MRIGFNLFNIVPGQGKGAGAMVYIYELIKHLGEVAPENKYLLFISPVSQSLFTELHTRHTEIITLPLDSRRKWLRPFVEQLFMPWLVKRYQLDVLHSPFSTAPLFCPSFNVMSLLDTVYFFYKEHLNVRRTIKARYYEMVQAIMARRCDAIITISEFSKSEIIRQLGVSSDKIFVTLLSPRKGAGIIPSSQIKPNTDVDASVILTAIASSMPHKNMIRLIEALGIVVSKDVGRVELHIIGQIPIQTTEGVGQKELEQIARANGVQENIHILGYVSDEELDALYCRASALVFPSFYEGFGIPPLEAMQFGVPVVCAKAASLPEVVGPAGLYFDPYDVNDMAEKIVCIIKDRGLRERLVETGYEWIKRYSWEKTARETLAVYHAICNKR